MASLPDRGLYVLTDCQRQNYPAMLDCTGRILAAGIAMLQYRDKNPDRETRRHTARRLQQLCREHRTPLIINDDVELAREIAADGVHLGSEDTDIRDARRALGDSAIIGISCYNRLRDAREARDQGADYVAFGAFFPTRSKNGTVPAGLELLREARAELHLPIAAIGGITLENCGPLIEAGADYLAVISCVYNAADPEDTVRRFSSIFRESA